MSAQTKHAAGQAVVMRRYGPPPVLELERIGLPRLAASDIRVRSLASAVNHSDLEIRSGQWPILRDQPFPYVSGLEVVGEVVETGSAVAEFRPGDRVVTMMQGLGGVRARRPGGYVEYVDVAAAATAPFAPDLDPLSVAALGLASVTAFEGLCRLGPISGRRIVVTGRRRGLGGDRVSVRAGCAAGRRGQSGRARRLVRRPGAAEVMLAHEDRDWFGLAPGAHLRDQRLPRGV